MSIADAPEFDIRYTVVGDMPLLRNWLKEEGMLHWYPPSTDEELENFVRIWVGFSQYNAALTALYKNEPVGMGVLYLMPYRKIAHQCMFQIIVSKEKQRHGVGRTLVRNLMHLAKTRFNLDLIHVEILDHSPLVKLLESLGFEHYGFQESYIKENGRYYPRILMERII